MMTPYLGRIVAVSLVAGLAAAGARASDLLEQYARAQEFDPTFQASRLEREIADEAVRESRGGVLPLLQATASGSRNYQDIVESNNILFTEGKTDFYNQNFVLSLTQPLYRQELLRRIPQAKSQVRQTVAVMLASEQDLIYRVTEAYFGLLAGRDDLELAVAERIAIQRQLEESEERLGAGLTSVTDVHDARARFALAQAQEIAARDTLEERRQALAEITGRVALDPAVLSEGFPLVRPDRDDVEAWVEAALFQSPNIKAREAAVEVAQQEIGLQRAGRLPTLDLVASFDHNDSGGTVFGEGNEIRTREVALRFGVPLFEGGRVAARTRAAALRHRMRLEELEREKRAVERSTRAAFRGIMSGIARAQAFQKSVFSHEAALASKEEAFRAGLDTGLSVLDARRELFLAKRDLARARYFYILNSLKLKQAVGTLSVHDLEQINAYLQ